MSDSGAALGAVVLLPVLDGDGHRHLAVDADATDTLCGRQLPEAPTDPAPVVDVAAAMVTTDQGPDIERSDSDDLRVAKWAAWSDGTCADCRHVLFADVLDHDCAEHIYVTGGKEWIDKTAYQSGHCGQCGRRLVQRLEITGVLGGETSYPVQETSHVTADGSP